ncbi:serine hydrolase domain-containing protein [soil metagenome]
MPSFRPPTVNRRTLLAGGLAAVAAPAMAENLDAFIATQMTAAGIPGLAVGYAKDGEVRMARGYGFADLATRRRVTADTMFHIASVTKTVTATAILQLVEAGKLDLDAPVAPHLDFPMANPRHPDAPITARQLLNHTSSLSDARYYEIDFRVKGRDADQPLGEMLKAHLVPGGATWSADGCFSAAAPGAAWDYCNIGYAVLGYLAGRIGGDDMRAETARAIFAPLAMKHTSWTVAGTPQALRETPYDLLDGVRTAVEPVGSPDWPGSMLRASITDVTAFAAASANGGHARGARILSASAMAQMLDMHQPAGLPDWLTGQGLGWQASNLDGKPRPNHWGGDPGVFTAAYLDPATRSAAVILTNLSVSDAGKTAVKTIAARLLQA